MTDIHRVITETLPKDLLLDLQDRIAAEALKAHEVVHDNFNLNAQRSRGAVGQLRFRTQEQGFEEVVQKHGGIILDDGVLLGTGLKIFQPFARFAGPSVGVILGFASMPEPRKIPPKNQSRASGVTLNYRIQPRLDLNGAGPQMTDIFVLFLVARDRRHSGMIEEVAIGVIGSDYKDYLFYKSLDAFLADYDTTPLTPNGGPKEHGAAVKLRPHHTRFVPPEEHLPENKVGDDAAD